MAPKKKKKQKTRARAATSTVRTSATSARTKRKKAKKNAPRKPHKKTPRRSKKPRARKPAHAPRRKATSRRGKKAARRDKQPRDKYGRFAPKRKRDKLGRYVKAPEAPKPPPRPRDAKGQFTGAPKPRKLPKLPPGFEPVPPRAPELLYPRDSLEYNRALIKQRFEEAQKRLLEYGLDDTAVETHVLRDAGWVDAELLVNVPRSRDAEELIVYLQDAFEPLPGGWRYSYGIIHDPGRAPDDLTQEQVKLYLRAGEHQFQTWYGYNLASVTEAGTEMLQNVGEFGYGDKPKAIYLRANLQLGPKQAIARTQRRFRQKGVKK